MLTATQNKRSVQPASSAIMRTGHLSRGPRSVHCLLIEDEPDTARYIASGLGKAGISVDHAGDADAGLARLAEGSCDVIILDRLLPGEMDGLSLLARLRQCGNDTPVLILSALGSLDERVRGLQGGADDYLTKPFALEELLARLHAMSRRYVARNDAATLEMADLVLDLRSRKVSRGGVPIALQPREFRLLEFLVRHRDQVVTRSMLLEAVWDVPVDPQVVDVQISRLRTKVDKGFSHTLIHTIRGIGYMARIED
jgi:two-component system OmpR family response regulator